MEKKHHGIGPASQGRKRSLCAKTQDGRRFVAIGCVYAGHQCDINIIWHILDLDVASDNKLDIGKLYADIYKLLGIFLFDCPDGADFARVKEDAVELVGLRQHFRSERRSDELGRSGQLVDHSY